MSFSLFYLLSLAPAVAGSNPFLEPDESEYFRMEDELVTVASRYAQSINQAPNIVNVISKEDIRARNYRTLSDVLRDLPGIYVWRSQEGRDLASFRGVISSDNNKFLLLVDGVPWYDGVYTHAWIDEYLPLHHVKQIEVLKGAGSAIYGTNAFAGVVNVVTMSGAELEGGRIRVAATSMGGFEVAGVAGHSGMVGGRSLDVSAMVRHHTQYGDGLEVTPRGRRNIRGDDPKQATNLGAKITWGGLEAQMHHVDYRHTYMVSEVDDVFDHLAADLDDFGVFYHNSFFQLKYTHDWDQRLVISPVVWLQRHRNPGSYFYSILDQTDSGAVDSFEMVLVETSKDTVRFGSHLELEARLLPGHVTIAGFGVERTRVIQFDDTEFKNFTREGVPTGFGAPSGSGLTNVFGYFQHSWMVFSQMELVGGLRLDKRLVIPGRNPDSRAFQLALSPRVAFVVAPTPSLSAKLMYGRAFRSPNVRETLVDAEFDEESGEYPFARGSVGVGPERIDTIESEFRLEPAPWLESTLVASFSTLEQEIDKVTPPNEYTNLSGGLNIWGVEGSAKLEHQAFTAQLSYAWTYARYRATITNPYSLRRQYEFPPHMAKGRIGLRTDSGIETWLSGELYSRRPRTDWTSDSGIEDGPLFGLVHLSARFSNIGNVDGLEVTAGIRNVLNSKYQVGVYRDDVNSVRGDEPKYPNGLEMPGRNLRVTVEYLF